MAANLTLKMKTNIGNIQVINIPKIHDVRGNLSVVEGNTIPFEIKRVYYLYDIPSGAKRGGHAHIEQEELLVALSGSFEIVLKDGNEEKLATLNRPDKGLLIPKGIWRELQNFSAGSVCLVVTSDVFNEADYIREYADFQAFKNS